MVRADASSTPTEVMQLRDCLMAVADISRPFGLQIRFARRSFHLKAGSVAERDAWLAAIERQRLLPPPGAPPQTEGTIFVIQAADFLWYLTEHPGCWLQLLTNVVVRLAIAGGRLAGCPSSLTPTAGAQVE